MKILVICQYYYPEPFRVTEICETLIEMGHEVHVITGLPNYPEGRIYDGYKNRNKRIENIKGVLVERCYEYPRGKGSFKLFMNYLSFMISASLKTLTHKGKYDVVLVNQLSPILMAIPAIIYKARSKTKLMLYCLDLWPESLLAGGVTKDSFVYKIFKWISKQIYLSSDMILVASKSFIEYFNDELLINKIKFEYLPQFAEELFENIDTNTSKEHTVFTFAGNIGEMQSVETIIYAAKKLVNHEDIIINIIGDGSKLQSCRDLALSLNLNNIIFHGRKPIEDMPKYYSESDAMLVTLKNNSIISKTLPGKIQSYLAAGKPIIGAINGESQFVINQSGCGYCCNSEDYEALASLMLKFKSVKENNDFSHSATEYYKQYYTKEKFMQRLRSNLELLVSQQST